MCAEIIVLHVLHRQRHLILPESRQRQLSWLDDLREYLWENRQFAEKFIKERIPQIKPVESDATYLMWLDCTDIASDSDELKDFICERSGLYVSSGSA